MTKLNKSQENQLSQAFRKAEREMPLSLSMKLDTIPVTQNPFERIYWIINGIGGVFAMLFIFVYREYFVDIVIMFTSLLVGWIKVMGESPLGVFGVPIITIPLLIISFCLYRFRFISV